MIAAELNKMIDGTDCYNKTLYDDMIATATAPGVIYSDAVHMTESGVDLIAKVVAREMKSMKIATDILK